ncbi:acyl-coenzyme A thioesterase PaaI-like protein [Bradyrhizobium sp. GM0.4]|jgi:hypothetical protein
MRRPRSRAAFGYKLNLLSPAVGEKRICRARVIKSGRQVSVAAAGVFCVSAGVETIRRRRSRRSRC